MKKIKIEHGTYTKYVYGCRCDTCKAASAATRRLYRKRTGSAYEKRKYRERRLVVNGMKDSPCTDCGNRFPPECMDFDHVKGKKLFTIGASVSSKSIQMLLDEIAKCELVCSNCHRIRTRIRKENL